MFWDIFGPLALMLAVVAAIVAASFLVGYVDGLRGDRRLSRWLKVLYYIAKIARILHILG